ncbi:phage integrase SAM-like domain-containing protein [Spirosoma sp.]|uniref:phage integrase SAM-like domain-containing protein n=1 Tax=Spirosoma sp. TaxID=1899569 RepID=UPI0026148B75|nr:phage integrase SAM-like domain-containing protein [Spirosoma sp.]MCX6216466.1 phage integrase SAM-like domain-containing protein [Spirosoma sp.]
MNIKRMEISFWRRQSRQKGKVQIYCRITIGGERIDLGSTGITTWHDHWDGQQITESDPESFFKNEQLDIMRNQLRAIFNDLFRRKEKITAAKIRRAYMGGSETVSLLSAFELYLKDSEKDPERSLKDSSLEVYDNVRKKLIDFLISQKALDLLVEDFDLSWVKRYRVWMKQIKLEGGKIGHADSYIVKHTQTIKNVLVWAKLHKLSDSNPLEGLRIKNATYDDPVFLTEDEFQRLRGHQFNNKHIQQAADVFIILCRCGFHYGDLLDFVKKHKTALRKGVDGDLWMIKDRIKTEVSQRVPQFEEVKTIVDKYGGWEKLPLTSLAKFNTWLKLVAAELNLPSDLSSKAGRKTFTDWCFNTLLLSTDSIKVLLGRKSDKGLEVYGRPDERRVAGELAASKVMQQRKKTLKSR